MNAVAHIAPAKTDRQRIEALERQVAELQALMIAKPKQVCMRDVIRFRLVGELPALQRRHPDGVSAKHVSAHFGVPIATTQFAIQRLTDAGKLIRYIPPRCKTGILLLPGQPTPVLKPATKSQRRVLEGMIGLSENGRLEMSQSRMARALSIDPSTLSYTLNCLILDGRVKVLKRGRAQRPSVYFIPRAIQ